MKHIKLFEKFISEKLDHQAVAKRVMQELDTFAQLHPQYQPKEVLNTIEGVLKKYKSLYGGKLIQKVGSEIRDELGETGNLANDAYRHIKDVDHIIMNALGEVDEKRITSNGFKVSGDLRKDVKKWIKKNKKEIDKLADEDNWYSIENMLVSDFGVEDKDDMVDLVNTFNFIY